MERKFFQKLGYRENVFSSKLTGPPLSLLVLNCLVEGDRNIVRRFRDRPRPSIPLPLLLGISFQRPRLLGVERSMSCIVA